MGETFGTFCYWAREGESEIQKVKIYSTLAHALKAFGRATHFGTLLKTLRQMKTRVSQGHEFLRFAENFDMFTQSVTQVRVEVTLKKTGTFVTTINRAWEVGAEMAMAMDTLLIPVGPYGDEARGLLDIASTHSESAGGRSKDEARPSVRVSALGFLQSHKTMAVGQGWVSTTGITHTRLTALFPGLPG